MFRGPRVGDPWVRVRFGWLSKVRLGLDVVRVRFGYGLVRLGLGPVRDGLWSFRICCNSSGESYC